MNQYNLLKWSKLTGNKELESITNDITKLGIIDKLVLEPFIFGKKYITNEEFEYINDSLENINMQTLQRIFNTLVKTSGIKVIPIFDIYNKFNEEIYITIAENNLLTLKYIIFPSNRINDIAFIDEILRNLQWNINEISNKNIYIQSINSIRYNQNTFKGTLLIIPNERIKIDKILEGVKIGTYECHDNMMLLQISDKLYYSNGNNLINLNMNNYIQLVSVINNINLNEKEINIEKFLLEKESIL